MKNLKLVFTAVMLSIVSIVFSQYAVVDYMKVRPGDDNAYRNTEKEWVKIHEARLNAGLIEGWTLYANMFTGADEPYQYATVTIYKDLASSAKGWDDKVVNSAYPEYNEKDRENFMNRTGASRVLSNVEGFYRIMGTDGPPVKKGDILMISAMHVKPGGEAAYSKLEMDVYMPLHKALVKAGAMDGWGIWEKFPGNRKDYQYVAVNVYSSLDQMGNVDYNANFKKVFPAMNMTEVTNKTNAARTVTETFIWRAVESVSKN